MIYLLTYLHVSGGGKISNTFVTDSTRDKIRAISEQERCSMSEAITRAVDILYESLMPAAEPHAFEIVVDTKAQAVIDPSHRLEPNNKVAETKRSIRAAWDKIKKPKTRSDRFRKIYG